MPPSSLIIAREAVTVTAEHMPPPRDGPRALSLTERDHNSVQAHQMRWPGSDELLSASNLTWRYLNWGRHEEENRDEFDRVEEELVVSCLERIDALDLHTCR